MHVVAESRTLLREGRFGTDWDDREWCGELTISFWVKIGIVLSPSNMTGEINALKFSWKFCIVDVVVSDWVVVVGLRLRR
jgi:hypothetical protein